MVVGEHERRVAAHELQLAVGLRLGPTEVVAVQVEREPVASDVALPAVGILDRHDDHHSVPKDPVDDTVVTVGEVVEQRDDGDTRQPFTIQSISKPLTYGLALEDRGYEEVLKKVGVEPSGDAFNSISLEPGTGHVIRSADHRVSERTAGVGRAERADLDAIARCRDGVEVRVALRGRYLAAAGLEPEHVQG